MLAEIIVTWIIY